MKIFDRILSGLLVFGAIGHSFGSIKFYRDQPYTLFWSLCASVLILLIAAINLLRTDRPADRGLAWLAATASAIYIGISIGFGLLIGNPLDVRVIGFTLVALGLTLSSVRQALAPI